MCLVELDWQSQAAAGVHQQTALLLEIQRMLYTAAACLGNYVIGILC